MRRRVLLVAVSLVGVCGVALLGTLWPRWVNRPAIGQPPTARDGGVDADASRLALATLSVPMAPECAETSACKTRGACTLRNEVCVTERREHCALSENCRRFGDCGFREGACVATKKTDCQKSQACRERGNCGLADSSCRPTQDEHCAASDACRKEGNCGASDWECLPKTDEHCRASEACRSEGKCRRLVDDTSEGDDNPRCGLDAHADCANSEFCRKEGRCRLAPLDFGGSGLCVAVTLVDKQRWPLTPARHGIQGTLVLAQDPKLPKSTAENWRGYWPDEADPRAAAALQVRDESGTVVSEATLYPDVGVQIEPLGSDTDTFFATEYLSCPAGHWCGWSTVLLEVRNGKISRVRAVNEAGKESAIVVSASQGARWKLERTANRRELVAQDEGPVPPGPALTERRFWFSDGRYHVHETKSEDYEPKVKKQPGRWHGSLEFHGTE